MCVSQASHVEVTIHPNTLENSPASPLGGPIATVRESHVFAFIQKICAVTSVKPIWERRPRASGANGILWKEAFHLQYLAYVTRRIKNASLVKARRTGWLMNLRTCKGYVMDEVN